MLIEKKHSGQTAPENILTKALLRASGALGVTNAELAAVLGVSTSYISKLRAGTSTLQLGTKTAELSTLLVRAFRSLDAIVGGDESVARHWLRNENTSLSGPPVELMKSIAGLVTTVEYLDQRRAPL